VEIWSLNTFIRDRICGTLTASSTAGVEGAWETMLPYNSGVADTAWGLNYDVSGFYIHVDSASANADYWIDIGIFDGTNTYEILSDFRIHTNRSYIGTTVYIPLKIPKNYEIRGRVKSNVGGASIWCALFLVSSSFTTLSYSAYKRYDVQVNTAKYSSIFEVVNSLPFHVKYIIVSTSLAQIDISPTSQFFWFKFYTGASGSEKELFMTGDGRDMTVDSVVDVIFPRVSCYLVSIPKGERLAISQDTGLTIETTFDYSIYIFG